MSAVDDLARLRIRAAYPELDAITADRAARVAVILYGATDSGEPQTASMRLAVAAAVSCVRRFGNGREVWNK